MCRAQYINFDNILTRIIHTSLSCAMRIHEITALNEIFDVIEFQGNPSITGKNNTKGLTYIPLIRNQNKRVSLDCVTHWRLLIWLISMVKNIHIQRAIYFENVVLNYTPYLLEYKSGRFYIFCFCNGRLLEDGRLNE